MAKHDVAVEVTVDGVPVVWDMKEVDADDVTIFLIELAAYVLVVGYDLDDLSTVRRDATGAWASTDPRRLSVLEILEVLMHGTEDEQRLLRMRIDAARAILN
jgi:hypothetical protein